MDNTKSRSKLTRRVLLGTGVLAGAAVAAGLGVLLSRKGGAITQGVSRARRVAAAGALPAETEVVVVGGGNIGCLTALSLAERGVRVVLCEKGVIAGEASGRSLGYIDSLFVDPAKAQIVARSKQLWEELNARVGADTGYRRTGTAALFGDVQGVDYAREWLKSAQGTYGSDGRILDAREAQALAVGSRDTFAGALYVPSDGIAEPQLAAPAVAEQARRRGGVVLQNCAVRGLETRAGRVSGVVTELGAIRCQSVVIAGGIWSPVFLRSLGLDLPQFMAFGSAMRFAAASGPSVGLVCTERGIVMRRGLQGSYHVCRPVAPVPITPATLSNALRLLPALRRMGDQLEVVLNVRTFMSQWSIPRRWPLDRPSPFEENRILVPQTHNDMVDEVARQVDAGFPAIARAGEVERWAGAMMSTLDNMPVISAVESHPGLFVGSGFYFGLTMAPAAGEALADLVTGHPPQIDLKLYRFSRFSDGSALEFRD